MWIFCLLLWIFSSSRPWTMIFRCVLNLWMLMVFRSAKDNPHSGQLYGLCTRLKCSSRRDRCRKEMLHFLHLKTLASWWVTLWADSAVTDLKYSSHFIHLNRTKFDPLLDIFCLSWVSCSVYCIVISVLSFYYFNIILIFIICASFSSLPFPHSFTSLFSTLVLLQNGHTNRPVCRSSVHC